MTGFWVAAHWSSMMRANRPAFGCVTYRRSKPCTVPSRRWFSTLTARIHKRAMSPSDSADKLLRLILESELEFSSEAVAGLASMTVEDTNRLWRALGFPDTSPGDVAYGQLDLDALRIVKASLDSGILDPTVERGLHLSLIHISEPTR